MLEDELLVSWFLDSSSAAAAASSFLLFPGKGGKNEGRKTENYGHITKTYIYFIQQRFFSLFLRLLYYYRVYFSITVIGRKNTSGQNLRSVNPDFSFAIFLGYNFYGIFYCIHFLALHTFSFDFFFIKCRNLFFLISKKNYTPRKTNLFYTHHNFEINYFFKNFCFNKLFLSFFKHLFLFISLAHTIFYILYNFLIVIIFLYTMLCFFGFFSSIYPYILLCTAFLYNKR